MKREPNLLEIDILDNQNFLKIKETLTRIGIASKKDNTLYQSCHILHKRGKYYITHFKEMFALDGRETTITEDDIQRRNTIAALLEQWNLCKVRDKDFDAKKINMSQVKVIPHKERDQWKLQSKYSIGVPKNFG